MSPSPLRFGVFGLGMMGRHHARILQSLPGVTFVGGADPEGDRHGAVRDGEVFTDGADLIAAGLDAAVVAVPSSEHEPVALQLAEHRIPCLIEKPLADSSDAAARIRDAFRTRGVLGCVGHVERFNPALVELKRRLGEGDLGRVFYVSTERVGPFPDRVLDVGVVKDLATHDLDIVTWITGSQFAEIAAQATHKMGRDHEDLVTVVGRLGNGEVVTMQVNRVTPTKKRQVTVLGERGAFVADLLTADLYLYSNGEISTEWDELARIKGVSEGDMIRYAIPKPEPLRSQLEAFQSAITGTPTEIVDLDQGVHILEVAERILASARESKGR